LKTNPTIPPDEIELEKTKFLLELIKDTSEEEIKERETVLIKNWAYNDEWNIKLFKLIVDISGLSEEEKKPIQSKEDSNFWKNVNIGKVVEINRYFRRTNSL
jgi:hypothetical protein